MKRYAINTVDNYDIEQEPDGDLTFYAEAQEDIQKWADAARLMLDSGDSSGLRALLAEIQEKN